MPPILTPASIRDLGGGGTVTSVAAGTGIDVDATNPAAPSVAIEPGVYRSGGTDVAVADGGTGASTAAAARTALGLVIGTDVAPVASPALTGTPTAPTPAALDNDTSIATTAFVTAADAAAAPRVWLPATAMATGGVGAPALANVGTPDGSQTAVFGLDAASDEICGGVLAMPSNWVTFDIDVIWLAVGTGGGTCRFRVDRQPITDGVTANTRTSFGTQMEVAGPAQYIVEVTRADSGIAAPATAIRIQVERDANHANDTMVGDMGVIGILLTRAS